MRDWARTPAGNLRAGDPGMNRRDFSRMILGALAATAIPRVRLVSQPTSLRINGQRLNDRLAALSQFGKNPQGGVTRLAYTDPDRAARATVMEWMRAARLEPSIDFGANIIGRRAGASASLRPIMFGSHIDSVPEGGNYDGDVGSLSAIEVAQTLAEAGVVTRHPIEVAIWANEEGGLDGSRAISGQLTAAELANVSRGGRTIEEGIRFLGGDPSKLEEARRARGSVAAYFELHIEQGGILDAARINIGIVEGIVGIREWDVEITGFANHAGTTPMDQRHDALLAAARFIEMVNRVVRSIPGRQVGTVGRIQATPGAPNVIPGQVVCTLELRDLDESKISSLYDRVRSEAATIGAENGTSFEFRPILVDVAAPSDPRMRSIIAAAAKTLGLTTRVMPSGAGHDAQAIAQIAPMGMIFIPSVGGISHSPREMSRSGDIVNGANVLLASVLAADRELI
jgi:beta-ureidopropionase / N-carbamoyl-L-amino-acid hydrolase